MKTLFGKKWYRPMEIAQLGLIQNSRGEAGTVASHYEYVLKLIRDGLLKARDYSHGTKPYYLVSEDEIENFNRSEP